ncbi:MAG TPA: WhiB family transcriptional regulator [Jiangellaceae bacterium]|nr:WhiB family transcriptional regulator [Jiangellaceae bacterium]
MNPDVYAVPAHAVTAWQQLQQQLADHGPTPCAGPSRDDWIGTRAQQARAADRCLDCPVIEACATYAETAPERYGTWGGYTPGQRATRREDTR